MLPYGLKTSDCSPRPKCSCCGTKLHGVTSHFCSPVAKARIKHTGAARGRQAGAREIKDALKD